MDKKQKKRDDKNLQDARWYLRRYKVDNPKKFARMQNQIRKFRREKNEALLKERQEQVTND
jgi:hypothetical protein